MNLLDQIASLKTSQSAPQSTPKSAPQSTPKSAPKSAPQSAPAPKRAKRKSTWDVEHELRGVYQIISTISTKNPATRGQRIYMITWGSDADCRASITPQEFHSLTCDEDAIRLAIAKGAPLAPPQSAPAPVVAPTPAPVVAPAPAPVVAPVSAPAPAPVVAPVSAPAPAPVVDPVSASIRLPIVDEQGRDIRPSRLPAWTSGAGVEEISWSDLCRYTEGRAVGLDHVWEMGWWSMIARTPLLLAGAPGDGKTMVTEMMSQIMAEARSAVVQMHPATEPAELLGSTSLRGLDHDLIARAWMDAPIGAHVLLIDEFEKASEATQQALLSLLAERSLRDGGRTFDLPIELLLATSNGEIYDGAVRDRWTLTAFTERMGEDYLLARWNAPPPFETSDRVTSKQLARWRTMASRATATIPANIGQRLYEASRYIGRSLMSEDGVTSGLSNRRQEQMQALIGAVSATHGRDYAMTSDMWVLQYLCHTSAQQEQAKAWLETTMEIAPLEGYRGMYYSTLDQSLEEALQAQMERLTNIMHDLLGDDA